MSDQRIGPGKVLEGFQSLIHTDEPDAPENGSPAGVSSTRAPSSDRSTFQSPNEKQRELTGVKPRLLPKTWRGSND